MANSVFRKPINNYSEIQKQILLNLSGVGAPSTSTIQAYPTETGVYRVGAIAGITGLPTGINGYGALVIFNAGSYLFHLYVDNNKKLYWATNSSSGNTASSSGVVAPSKWRYVEGTEVNAASAS